MGLRRQRQRPPPSSHDRGQGSGDRPIAQGRSDKIEPAGRPHVAKVREHAEKAGDVETVTTSVDTKGRKQPTSKPRKADRLAKAGRKRKSGPPPTQLTVTELSVDKL